MNQGQSHGQGQDAAAADVVCNTIMCLYFVVVEPMKPAWYRLRKHFGEEFFHSDGTLDRKKLGQLVFSDRSQREILDSVTHPEIYKSIVWRLLRYLLSGTVISEFEWFFD